MSQDGRLNSGAEISPVSLLACDFDASFQAIRDVLARLRACLAAKNASAEDIGGLELLLSEVLTNVVKHAYAGRTPERIQLALTCDDKSVYVEVGDTGAALPGGKLPLGSPLDPRIQIETQPENGFGWILIRALATDISYAREGASNRLRFRMGMPLKGEASGAADIG